jgi:hypothetical protein
MMQLSLLGVRTPTSMVEGKYDEAVMYVISETGFGSLRIVKGVHHLMYMSDTHMGERY